MKKILIILAVLIFLVLACYTGIYEDPAGWVYVYIALPGQSISNPLIGYYFYTADWQPAVFPTDIPPMDQ